MKSIRSIEQGLFRKSTKRIKSHKFNKGDLVILSSDNTAIYEVLEFLKDELHTEVYKIKNVKSGFEMDFRDDAMTLDRRVK
ncbi:MAG: hypothetical protein E2O29_02105 [Deltaproteobacteria bacterium]|nr:MAG: hypothetical protein E2O29_02105 [Deltaproteobacteria bacterium]